MKLEGANNADREYFVRHCAEPSLKVLVGKPIVSRSTGSWVIPVSRRFNNAADRFVGVVLATIELDPVNQILTTFEIGHQGALALALSDGTILVRRPFAVENLGKSLAGTPLQQSIATRASDT
ncbi:MAG: hypothetical protein EON56_00085 [Alphaproteobacteria bacterium]|nr:MAG: hypothetical protein EON56_00085 [Alphaproteobacteria bacterium]